MFENSASGLPAAVRAVRCRRKARQRSNAFVYKDLLRFSPTTRPLFGGVRQCFFGDLSKTAPQIRVTKGFGAPAVDIAETTRKCWHWGLLMLAFAFAVLVDIAETTRKCWHL